MILGLSHVGLTGRSLEDSIGFYCGALGFSVLADSERRGQWVEELTGIPGFHTRNVYLALTAANHIELFDFYHPPKLSASCAAGLRIGIHGLTVVSRSWTGTGNRAGDPGVSSCADPLPDCHRGGAVGTELCSSALLRDPNGIAIELSQPASDQAHQKGLFPTLVVGDLPRAVRFYETALGLRSVPSDPRAMDSDGGTGAATVASRLLVAGNQTCLRLVQPKGVSPLPMEAFRMERVGLTHVALAVTDMAAAQKRISGGGGRFQSLPVRLRAGPHEGGQSVYFQTPDGFTLELLESPFISRSFR